MTSQIAVTGSTGRIGGLVADHLAEAGVAMRLLVRTPDRAPVLPNTSVHQVTYQDGAAAREALTGVKLAFMVSAAEAKDRVDEHRSFARAAADAGVEHLVYLSFAGASATSTFTLGRDHFATEEFTRELGQETGLVHTFLRDNFYADFMPMMVGDDGVIRGPAGDGRVAIVAQRDVAAVAGAVLLDADAHRGATYTLTGPQALTLTEIADIVSTSTGRDVRFHNETIEEAYESRASYGAPDWMVDAWVSTYTSIAAGEVAETTNDVSSLTGRPATSLQELLTTHSA